MFPGRKLDAADYSALRNGYVSCIEVNVPLTERPTEHGTRVSTHDACTDQLHQLSEPDISEAVSRWNIFPQGESIAESDSQAARHAENGESGGENTTENRETSASYKPLHTRVTEKGVDTGGLLPEKILLLPYDVLHRLHKSHLAQLDELWALRALHQRRQLNVQKWPYLKEACQQFGSASVFMVSIQYPPQKDGMLVRALAIVEVLSGQSRAGTAQKCLDNSGVDIKLYKNFQVMDKRKDPSR